MVEAFRTDVLDLEVMGTLALLLGMILDLEFRRMLEAFGPLFSIEEFSRSELVIVSEAVELSKLLMLCMIPLALVLSSDEMVPIFAIG